MQRRAEVWELPKCIAVIKTEKSKLLPIGPHPFAVATTRKSDRNFLSVQIWQRNSFQRWEVTKASLWVGHRSWNQTISWGVRSGRLSVWLMVLPLLMTLVKSHDLWNPQYPDLWSGIAHNVYRDAFLRRWVILTYGEHNSVCPVSDPAEGLILLP